MTTESASGTQPPPRGVWWQRDGLIALSTFIGTLLLYGSTMCRSVYWYDSAELTGAAVSLGVPHPPGAPVFVLVAHVFTWAPLDPAIAVNFVSVFFGALAASLAYGLLRELRCRRLAALCGVLALVGSGLFWAQAVVAELYTMSTSLLLVVLWLLLRGLRRDDARQVVAAAAVAGLSLGVHYSIATLGLGLVALVLGLGLDIERAAELRKIVSGEQLGRRLRVAAACLGALGVGASVLLVTIALSAADPAVHVADITNLEWFVWYITGGAYKGWFLEGAGATWIRVGDIARVAYAQFLLVGCVLGVAGLGVAWRRQPLHGLALTLMIAGNLWYFHDYNVHDVAVFWLPSYVVFTLCIGLGTDAAIGWLRTAASRRGRPALAHVGIALLVVASAAPIPLEHRQLDLSDYREAEAYGLAVADQLPAGAYVLAYTSPTTWHRMTVFEYYMQAVRGLRPDVTVVHTPRLIELRDIVRSGRPVYLFAPYPPIDPHLEIVRDGVLFRVVKFSPSGSLTTTSEDLDLSIDVD